MPKAPYERSLVATIAARLAEQRGHIQVLSGPRQSGKTTLIGQALAHVECAWHYATADLPTLQSQSWLATEWETARESARSIGKAVLVLDEVQKVAQWSEVVKRLWDEDSWTDLNLHVVLLGSAPILVQRGLTESLAGRFEVIRVPHWSFTEMREAFGLSLEEYVYFGGYPGGVRYLADRERWVAYINDALIETTLARDVLLLTRVDKPALLRQLFQLGCDYSGQIVSFQKLVGQLQDAGNTTTLAHYLELLHASGLLAGLQKYSGARIRQRASSPKLLALNTGLISASSLLDLPATRARPDLWGRLVESTVGAHLANSRPTHHTALGYWREGPHEVDFVLSNSETTIAIEVKSGRTPGHTSGLGAFLRAFPAARPLIVGTGGVPLEEFFGQPAGHWLR